MTISTVYTVFHCSLASFQIIQSSCTDPNLYGVSGEENMMGWCEADFLLPPQSRLLSYRKQHVLKCFISFYTTVIWQQHQGFLYHRKTRRHPFILLHLNHAELPQKYFPLSLYFIAAIKSFSHSLLKRRQIKISLFERNLWPETFLRQKI